MTIALRAEPIAFFFSASDISEQPRKRLQSVSDGIAVAELPSSSQVRDDSFPNKSENAFATRPGLNRVGCR